MMKDIATRMQERARSDGEGPWLPGWPTDPDLERWLDELVREAAAAEERGEDPDRYLTKWEIAK